MALAPSVSARTPIGQNLPGSASLERRREVDALRNGGIRAAAALTGHYEGIVSANPENNVETLEQLVAWHELIVVGKIGRSQGWLADQGQTIVTEYQVAVERVLKGPRLSEVLVSVVGGSVSFPEGTTATLTSDMAPPISGQRYVFFLMPSQYRIDDSGPSGESHSRAWALQHLSLGVFLLAPERGVVPRARPDHPLMKAFTGMTEREFLAAVTRQVGSRRSGAAE